MRTSWFAVPAILILVVLPGCASQVSRHVEEARATIEMARAAGAAERAPQEFQAATWALTQSEARMRANNFEDALAADYYAGMAMAAGQSAIAAVQLRTDLEKARAEAQAARQEAEQARAEAARLETQARAAEEATRAAQARAEPAEAQVATPKPQAAAPATPAAAYDRYVVKPGDTLRKIAARPEIYGDAGQWSRLHEANRDIIGRDGRLTIGQVLMIPRP